MLINVCIHCHLEQRLVKNAIRLDLQKEIKVWFTSRSSLSSVSDIPRWEHHMAVVASRTSPGLKSEAIYENQHYARGIDGVASSFIIDYNSFNKTMAAIFPMQAMHAEEFISSQIYLPITMP